MHTILKQLFFFLFFGRKSIGRLPWYSEMFRWAVGLKVRTMWMPRHEICQNKHLHCKHYVYCCSWPVRIIRQSLRLHRRGRYLQTTTARHLKTCTPLLSDLREPDCIGWNTFNMGPAVVHRDISRHSLHHHLAFSNYTNDSESVNLHVSIHITTENRLPFMEMLVSLLFLSFLHSDYILYSPRYVYIHSPK